MGLVSADNGERAKLLRIFRHADPAWRCLRTAKRYDWKVEFAVPVLLGIPDKAVLPAPQGQLGLGGSYYAANDKQQNTAFIFPKQAYVRLKDGGSSLQAGRFEFTDGSEVKPKDPDARDFEE